MAKQTLLELVQDVLSAIDGDEVNSVSDTIEATQIAGLFKRSYYDLITEQDLPVNGVLRALEGVADPDRPTHMRIPENVESIEWIKYNIKIDNADDNVYLDMAYKTPAEFVTL
jgi:hypothetical protein